MQNLSKLFISILVAFLIPGVSTAAPLNKDTTYNNSSGMILINIHNYDDIYEFKLDASNGTLAKTYQTDVLTYKKNNFTYRIFKSKVFENIYKEERRYKAGLEKKLIEILSRLDLSVIEKLCRFARGNDCSPDTVRSVKLFRPDINYKNADSKTLGTLIPNRQLTHIAYETPTHNAYDDPNWNLVNRGLVVDLNNELAYFPLCGRNNIVVKLEWSKNGRYIAYLTSEDIHVRSKVLIVKDVVNHCVVFQRKMDEWIEDIAWSPDSKNIAVLTKREQKSYNPIDLLGALFGHGSYHNSFYLKIYNLDGKELLNFPEIKEVKAGKGSLVWTVASPTIYKEIQ